MSHQNALHLSPSFSSHAPFPGTLCCVSHPSTPNMGTLPGQGMGQHQGRPGPKVPPRQPIWLRSWVQRRPSPQVHFKDCEGGPVPTSALNQGLHMGCRVLQVMQLHAAMGTGHVTALCI